MPVPNPVSPRHVDYTLSLPSLARYAPADFLLEPTGHLTTPRPKLTSAKAAVKLKGGDPLRLPSTRTELPTSLTALSSPRRPRRAAHQLR